MSRLSQLGAESWNVEMFVECQKAGRESVVPTKLSMHSNVTVSMEYPGDTPCVVLRNVIKMSKRQISQNTPPLIMDLLP